MLKKLRHTLAFGRALQNGAQDLRVTIARSMPEIAEAKKLHAKVFLARGYVTEADLTSDGLHIGLEEDPYQLHSQYFIVERKNGSAWTVVASSRVILADPAKGHHSFQTYLHQRLYSNYKQLLQRTAPEDCAEVSGLVKERGEDTVVTLMLYRSMWQFSLDEEHKYWLMSCDSRLYKRLKLLFGNTLVESGKSSFFKGHTVVPVILDIPGSVDRLLKISGVNPVKRQLQKKLIRFFLVGLPERHLNSNHMKVIERHKLNTRKAASEQ